jgi:hypothetical protein
LPIFASDSITSLQMKKEKLKIVMRLATRHAY